MFSTSELYAKVFMALSKGQTVEIILDGISIFYRIREGQLQRAFANVETASWSPMDQDLLIKASWKIDFHSDAIVGLSKYEAVQLMKKHGLLR